MIRELVRMVEKELGFALPSDATHRLEAALCQQYGGERVYVPKLPKLVHQVRIASLGTATTSMAVLATELGMTSRQVRRIVRGR